jgi:hypothetical protein
MAGKLILLSKYREGILLMCRIQYAFARVNDPSVSWIIPGHGKADNQSKLDKFVLISWCGDGVPEFKKGLYRKFPSALFVDRTDNRHPIVPSRIKVPKRRSPSHPS